MSCLKIRVIKDSLNTHLIPDLISYLIGYLADELFIINDFVISCLKGTLDEVKEVDTLLFTLDKFFIRDCLYAVVNTVIDYDRADIFDYLYGKYGEKYPYIFDGQIFIINRIKAWLIMKIRPEKILNIICDKQGNHSQKDKIDLLRYLIDSNRNGKLIYKIYNKCEWTFKAIDYPLILEFIQVFGKSLPDKVKDTESIIITAILYECGLSFTSYCFGCDEITSDCTCTILEHLDPNQNIDLDPQNNKVNPAKEPEELSLDCASWNVNPEYLLIEEHGYLIKELDGTITVYGICHNNAMCKLTKQEYDKAISIGMEIDKAAKGF